MNFSRRLTVESLNCRLIEAISPLIRDLIHPRAWISRFQRTPFISCKLVNSYRFSKRFLLSFHSRNEEEDWHYRCHVLSSTRKLWFPISIASLNEPAIRENLFSLESGQIESTSWELGQDERKDIILLSFFLNFYGQIVLRGIIFISCFWQSSILQIFLKMKFKYCYYRNTKFVRKKMKLLIQRKRIRRGDDIAKDHSKMIVASGIRRVTRRGKRI